MIRSIEQLEFKQPTIYPMPEHDVELVEECIAALAHKSNEQMADAIVDLYYAMTHFSRSRIDCPDIHFDMPYRGSDGKYYYRRASHWHTDGAYESRLLRIISSNDPTLLATGTMILDRQKTKQFRDGVLNYCVFGSAEFLGTIRSLIGGSWMTELVAGNTEVDDQLRAMGIIVENPGVFQVFPYHFVESQMSSLLHASAPATEPPRDYRFFARQGFMTIRLLSEV